MRDFCFFISSLFAVFARFSQGNLNPPSCQRGRLLFQEKIGDRYPSSAPIPDAFSFQPYDLLVQQHIFFPDDLVFVIVSEEVVLEPAPLADLLQKVGEGIRFGQRPQQVILDACGRAVGEEVVHRPPGPAQAGPGLGIFRLAGQLLPPPGAVVDPEGRALGVEPLEPPQEVRRVRFQDAVLDVVAAGAAHGEEDPAAQVEHLPPLQHQHRGPDDPHPAALPLPLGIGGQGIVVLMVAGNKDGGEGPGLQEVQPRIVPAVAVPHAAEVTGDQDDILFCQSLLLIKVLRPEAAEVSVGVSLSRCKNYSDRCYKTAEIANCS